MFFLSKENFAKFVGDLAEKNNLFISNADKPDSLQKITAGEKNQSVSDLGSVRTQRSVKEFLFPPKERVLADPEYGKTILFGIKECDRRSIEMLDKIFLEEEPVDEFYKKRRENTIIITSDCTDANENCFCSYFESEPFSKSGFDLNFSIIKGQSIMQFGATDPSNFRASDIKLNGASATDVYYGVNLANNGDNFSGDFSIKNEFCSEVSILFSEIY